MLPNRTAKPISLGIIIMAVVLTAAVPLGTGLGAGADIAAPPFAPALVLPFAQEAKLNGADEEPSDQFAFAVAISGDTILVGSWGEDPDLGSGPLNNAGAAYIFVRTGTVWTQEAKLVAADAEAGDQFGRRVAIEGDNVVIGARFEDPDLGAGPINDAGSAYVFVRSGTTWTQQAKLVAVDAEAGDSLGRSVGISGDTVVVGSRFEDPDLGAGPILDAGSAYVFVRSGTTWTQQAKLNASDAQADDAFGPVTIEGDTIVVGAWGEDPDLGSGPLVDAGSAYVFTRSGTTWTQQAKIVASDAEAGASFARSANISGDTVVFGARFDDPDPGGGALGDAGAAYVFVTDGTTWTQQAKLVADDAEAGDELGVGSGVSISGDLIVVGAWGEDPDLGAGPLNNAGSAYVFARAGTVWTQEAKLNASDAEAGDQFGRSASISGETVVVGARLEDPNLGEGSLNNAGSAYVFVLSDEATPTPTATPTAIPPTDTPTATPTALPPTATPTALPPTATPTALPPTATPTSLPPTATPEPEICPTVLDDFNRPDGELGTSWLGRSRLRNYGIVNEQVEVTAGGPLYWEPEAFGADQEACVTLVNIDPKGLHSVLLKVQGETPHFRNGAIKVYYDLRDLVGIKTYIPGEGWTTLATFDVVLQDGDQLGGRALADGTVQAYVNGELVGEADAGPFFADTGGWIGMWFASRAKTPTGILDDFRGGDV